ARRTPAAAHAERRHARHEPPDHRRLRADDGRRATGVADLDTAQGAGGREPEHVGRAGRRHPRLVGHAGRVLTIGQLAAYAGVTPRAVRHYHQIGLLPEPERNFSGYRSYGARDVVELIRIRTLAEAGVPLARVQELLEAGDEEFSEAVADI